MLGRRGDPKRAAPDKLSRVDNEITDPDIEGGTGRSTMVDGPAPDRTRAPLDGD